MCWVAKSMAPTEKTVPKQLTPFKPGQSGNPSGRPKGSRNATTLALESLLDGQATALTQKAIDLALAGDMAALRICMDRILPPRKDRPIAFDSPQSRPLPKLPPPCQPFWQPLLGARSRQPKPLKLRSWSIATSAPLRQRNWPLASNASKG